MPQKSKVKKMQGEFYRLTADEIVSLSQKLTDSELKTLLYLKALNPFGDRFKEIDTSLIADRLGISRRSIQRFLKKFKGLGLIEWEISKFSYKIKCDPSDARTTAGSPERQQDRQNDPSDAETTAGSLKCSEGSPDIYIDPARGQTIQTNTDLNQTVADSDAHAQELISTTNSMDESIDKIFDQGKLHTEPLATTEYSSTLVKEDQDPGQGQGSGACSTNVNKASDTSTTPSCDNTTQVSTEINTKTNGDRAPRKSEAPKPKPNVPKTAYDASLEYEAELSKEPWEKIDFTPEDEVTFEQVRRCAENPYERPWKAGRVNYIKGLVAVVREANSWYSQPAHRDRGYEVGHLRNLEQAIQNWENKPFDALEAYDRLMGYVAKVEQQEAQPEGKSISDQDLMAAFDQALNTPLTEFLGLEEF